MCCWFMIKKLRNIILGWWFKITGSNYELYKKRMDICKECEHKTYILNDYWCSQCGCNLSAKCRVKEEKCLMNKW